MATKAAMDNKSLNESPPGSWPGERAPSSLRADDPYWARLAGFLGLMFVSVSAMGFVITAFNRQSRVLGPGLTVFLGLVGLAGLLYHSSRDGERQVRRMYGFFGLGCLVAGLVFGLASFKLGTPGLLFLVYGAPALFVGLLFLLTFAHHETDEAFREGALKLLLYSGSAMAALAFFGGNLSNDFLNPFGVILGVLGLLYFWAYMGQRGPGSEAGHFAGVLTGVVGLIVIAVAVIRSAIPAIMVASGASAGRVTPYLVPSGMLLIVLGGIYAFSSLCLCSDNRLVVMTRRELSAIFYSPIAYIVLLSMTGLGWVLYGIFVGNIKDATLTGRVMIEPIIRYYIVDWFVIIPVIFLAPALTMRLLSEEQRSGTLEVLLTAPVDEASVVISKFFAVLIFYMLIWVPWGLFLVALRVQGGEPFDYRPLLSFFFALIATGSGFLSMGLFFSSLTKNQIASFILGVVGMLGLTMIYFGARSFPADSPGRVALEYVSYIELWMNSLEGTLSPRHLMFHISAAIFWLFLTVKVLEARRWS